MSRYDAVTTFLILGTFILVCLIALGALPSH